MNAPRAVVAVGDITNSMAFAALYHSSRKGTSALVSLLRMVAELVSQPPGTAPPVTTGYLAGTTA